MPEELPAEETGGAPEATQTQNQPDTDWQKRYTDTQAWGNTLNEQISSLKSDPNALVGFLREHHPDLLEEDEPEPTEPAFEPDEEDRPLTRAEFEAWKSEQTQAAQAKSSQDQFEADYKTVLNGREIPKHGDRAIRYALNQGEIRNSDDLKTAVDEYFTELEAAAKPKPRPRVPHTPANGQANTGTKRWSEMTEAEALAAQVEMASARDTQM